MRYLSNLTEKDIMGPENSFFSVPIVHKQQKYYVKVPSDWLDLNTKTKHDLIEYFKLCIDTKTYKGILTVKT